jgi:hypothetical protein
MTKRTIGVNGNRKMATYAAQNGKESGKHENIMLECLSVFNDRHELWANVELSCQLVSGQL